MRCRLWVPLAIVLGCAEPQSRDTVPGAPLVEAASVETAVPPPPAEPSVERAVEPAVEPEVEPATGVSDAPGARRPKKVCGPEPQVCCCLPRDSVDCWRCSPWNHPAPAEMLDSCVKQCNAGHREACFRAALSFGGIQDVKPNKARAEALLRRACELELQIACL